MKVRLMKRLTIATRLLCAFLVITLVPPSLVTYLTCTIIHTASCISIS